MNIYVKEIDGFEISKNKNQKIWRYITSDKLRELLEKKSIYFPSVRELCQHDEFEGSISHESLAQRIPGIKDKSHEELKSFKEIYGTSFQNKAFEGLLDMYYASCWHKSQYESFLMWRVYGQEKAICIQTTVERLCNSIGEYRVSDTSQPENIWVGDVKYVDYKSERMDSGMLERFFHKRIEFIDEKEFRLIISLRFACEWGAATPGVKVRVPIDTLNLIEKIYLSPTSDKRLEEEVHGLLEQNKISSNIIFHSSLDDVSVYG